VNIIKFKTAPIILIHLYIVCRVCSLRYPAYKAYEPYYRILPFVDCLAVRDISTLFHKGYDFRENVIEHEKCVLIFSTIFVSNISDSKKDSDRCYRLKVKYPLFLCDFKENFYFHYRFSKSSKISNFMNIRPVRAELFKVDGRPAGRTDGQT